MHNVPRGAYYLNWNVMMTPAPAVKQVLLVRKDLKMPPGKIAAQAAHAAQCSLTHAPANELRRAPSGGWELVVPLSDEDVAWLQGEYKKVALGVSGEEELLALLAEAKAAGFRTFLVEDNGHTVFRGRKTITAVGIGPALAERVDLVTGHLRPL
ncbi:peptidyl-tRNA hydrolase [compost metagenome]